MENVVDFKSPLLKLKEEVDAIQNKIDKHTSDMKDVEEFVHQYETLKDQRKELKKKKKEKMMTLKIIASFYEEATGEKADPMFPLFAQETEQ